MAPSLIFGRIKTLTFWYISLALLAGPLGRTSSSSSSMTALGLAGVDEMLKSSSSEMESFGKLCFVARGFLVVAAFFAAGWC